MRGSELPGGRLAFVLNADGVVEGVYAWEEAQKRIQLEVVVSAPGAGVGKDALAVLKESWTLI